MVVDRSDRLTRYLNDDRFVECDVLRHEVLSAGLGSVLVFPRAHEAGVLLVFDDLLGSHDRQLQLGEFSQGRGVRRVFARANRGDEVCSTETKSLQERFIPEH